MKAVVVPTPKPGSSSGGTTGGGETGGGSTGGGISGGGTTGSTATADKHQFIIHLEDIETKILRLCKQNLSHCKR